MQTIESCKRAVDEWRSNVTRNSIEKNWRKLFYTIDEAYTVLHICGDTMNEISYDMLVDYVMVNLAKMIFGYIYTDAVLYGQYLLNIFKKDKDIPMNVLEQIHSKANDKNEITVDEIKEYTLKLLSSIINYIYTPY